MILHSDNVNVFGAIDTLLKGKEEFSIGGGVYVVGIDIYNNAVARYFHPKSSTKDRMGLKGPDPVAEQWETEGICSAVYNNQDQCIQLIDEFGESLYLLRMIEKLKRHIENGDMTAEERLIERLAEEFNVSYDLREDLPGFISFEVENAY